MDTSLKEQHSINLLLYRLLSKLSIFNADNTVYKDSLLPNRTKIRCFTKVNQKWVVRNRKEKSVFVSELVQILVPRS